MDPVVAFIIAWIVILGTFCWSIERAGSLGAAYTLAAIGVVAGGLATFAFMGGTL